MTERCELYDRECINCGECTVCDLDSTKRCDNCCKCIESEGNYRSVNLQKFIEEQNKKEKKQIRRAGCNKQGT
jgi:hypothetical protein